MFKFPKLFFVCGAPAALLLTMVHQLATYFVTGHAWPANRLPFVFITFMGILGLFFAVVHIRRPAVTFQSSLWTGFLAVAIPTVIVLLFSSVAIGPAGFAALFVYGIVGGTGGYLGGKVICRH